MQRYQILRAGKLNDRHLMLSLPIMRQQRMDERDSSAVPVPPGNAGNPTAYPPTRRRRRP